MQSLIQQISSERQGLEKILPIIPSIDEIEEANDYLIGYGLTHIRGILEDTSGGAKDKVTAFNSLINLGRYIEVRRTNVRDKDKMRLVMDNKNLNLYQETE
jgi:hypothetical protein